MFKAGERFRFTKMTGSGNDFILMDNRDGHVDPDRYRELARLACRRKFSAGADGLILIEEDPEVDFKWSFFNADGSTAEMCGNGARCAARFVHLHGIVAKPQLAFRTLAGIIEATIRSDKVKIRVTLPHGLESDVSIEAADRPFKLHFINTGVPHVVCLLEGSAALENADVSGWGRALRFHPLFQPAGTNVNFIALRDDHRLAIRTYERGVEDETLACGTGSIASALVSATLGLTTSPVDVITRSGETLTIYFDRTQDGDKWEFSEVYLEGDAKVVYEGELWDETLRS